MRAAKIVYFILGIVVLLPWLVYSAKKKFSKTRVFITVLVSLLIISGVYAHYRFTIGYQIPLAAERAGTVFLKRIEGKMDFSAYQNEMQKQELSTGEGVQTVSDEELEKTGIDPKQTDMLLSERVYSADDGSMIVYVMYDDGIVPLYSYIQLKQTGYRWNVVTHGLITKSEFDELNKELKIKFYSVGS